MRNPIVHPGADELKYEIREIVELAHKIQRTGISIIWENIGDPIAKGETIPDWIRELIVQTVRDDQSSYGYSPTKGDLKTRQFLAAQRNAEGGVQITAEDILFFNGLGDAISTVYNYLHEDARVIGPNPAYPTHSSAEAAHSGKAHFRYRLNPDDNWRPDLMDLEQKIKDNPEISGILLVNPDNPTGMVYDRATLEAVVDLARTYKLFIISDEIYANLVYGGMEQTNLAKVLGEVPGMAMRGISKEIPWPGARCGWVEFYNRDADIDFNRYVQTIIDAKMLEVCSTTLPQKVMPKIMSDTRYPIYLKERNLVYQKRAERAYAFFSTLEGVRVCKVYGAFYMTVLFDESLLNTDMRLPAANPDAEALIAPLLAGSKPDKQFVYNLLASEGICVVPLSTGFNSDLMGFRMTLLEPDFEKFEHILSRIGHAIQTLMRVHQPA